MKNKEEELNSIIMELRKNNASLQEKLVKEESDKLVSVNIFYWIAYKVIDSLLFLLFFVI